MFSSKRALNTAASDSMLKERSSRKTLSGQMNPLQEDYRRRFDAALVPIAKELERYLRELLEGEAHIDRIVARAKSIPRFLAKAAKIDKGVLKYSDPLHQIQDQIGARIVTFYLP